MKKFVVVALALCLALPAVAQQRTKRHSLDYTSNESQNRALEKIDATLSKGRIHRKFITCGDGVSSSTTYQGPYIASFRGLAADDSIDGTICDTFDNTTEATADAPLPDGFPDFWVTGADCCVDADPAAAVTFTLRSAEADLVPSGTCTIPAAGTDQCCQIRFTTFPKVASGATVADSVLTGEDLSTTGTGCTWFIEYN